MKILVVLLLAGALFVAYQEHQRASGLRLELEKIQQQLAETQQQLAETQRQLAFGLQKKREPFWADPNYRSPIETNTVIGVPERGTSRRHP